MTRKQQRLFRFAVDIFIELLYQTTHNRVNYKCNDQDVTAFGSFLEEYGDSIGENFIREFAEYGIQSWFNSGSEKDYTHSIRFNWVFSKAAIKRWDALPGHVRTKVVRTSLKKNAKINTIKKHTVIPDIVTTVRPVEEKFKAQYYNTQRGLLWCVANTSMFFHKSSYCTGCIHKEQCKETLKNTCPKVYMLRGYGK